MLSRVTALMGIKTRLKLARLLLVVDAAGGHLNALVADSCYGGADGVIVEAGSVRREHALRAVTQVRRGGQPRQALIGFAGDPDAAGEAGVDLLLLGDGVDARGARRVLSEWARVGRSCNSAEEVDAALADPGIDFLLVGPGLEHIRHAAAVAPQDDPASKPWFAAGGVSERTLDIVLGAGAYRVAVGRAIRDAEDPVAAAREFADRLRAAWVANPAMDAVTDSAFDDQPVATLPPSSPTPAATDLTL